MSHPHDPIRDIVSATARAVPPVTVAYITLNEWVAIASIAYVALQAAYLIWRWRGEWLRRKAARAL